MNIPSHITHLLDQRRGDSPQLWLVGCSIAHGQGVGKNQRYGELLAQQLDLEVSWLTHPGTSIMYHADQLIRSDIRENDVVVWGVTEPSRYFTYHEHYRRDIGPRFTNNVDPNMVVATQDRSVDVFHYPLNPPNVKELTRILSPDAVYQSIDHVLQVKNYCDKMKCRLLLVDMFKTELHDYFQDWPNYLRLINMEQANSQDPDNWLVPFFDSAADGYHPGPQTHQWYADSIYKKFFT